ncbi:hypothetical protein BS329_11210 [Amycolatopsis coloradensis]|uniref:Uncharacterized protein n=1 Tax=Amycolatopsis coloradensis TaxID=76021 RepID=A0A1R0KWL8_9PSEU|nr:hypothetical protein [Amycolatopsis coloradensis]OLZ53362.1 hypothetical protein BS329_11210 [Amycolatopsis coloradensis]
MGRKKATSTGPPPWTQRDEALRYTCYLAAMVAGGHDLSLTPEVLAPFPAVNADDERLWAVGQFILSDFRALGNGSWQVNTPMVVGTGAVGLGLVAGSLIGGAVAKSRARAAAQAAAVPRWVPMDRGSVYASSYGFYLYTPQVFRWRWSAMTAASIVAPATLHFAGDSASGPISWLLQSDYAELLFVIWALNQHPQHPQLVTGGWLPRGWLQHARAHGRQPDIVPALMPALPPADTSVAAD